MLRIALLPPVEGVATVEPTRTAVLLAILIIGVIAAVVSYRMISGNFIRDRLLRMVASVAIGLVVSGGIEFVHLFAVVIPQAKMARAAYPDGWRESRNPMIIRIIELGAQVTSVGDPEEQRIDVLDFRNSKLTDSDLTLFSSLKSLELLVLAGTQITDAGVVQIQGLKSLKSLYLSNTRIGDQSLTNIRNLPKLEELDLSETRVTDEGLKNLEGISTLRRLSLDDTRISELGISHLATLPNLEYLSLYGCPVLDGSINDLRKLTSLQSLNLCRTGITEAGAERLRVALPKCRVEVRH